ncbi:MAG: hypothetical protein ACD_23C01000G0004 [uncultured bacterium]|nr:MAG: hypothetical protein ACD_23C01000G0004 [uncultured bacterium]
MLAVVASAGGNSVRLTCCNCQDSSSDTEADWACIIDDIKPRLSNSKIRMSCNTPSDASSPTLTAY